MEWPECRNPWKTLSSREAYHNEWFRIREDDLVRPDGSIGSFAVVEIPRSAGVVAVDRADRVALVRQWRYALDRPSIEIPAGVQDPGDSDLKATAERELREEAGFRARRWAHLGSVHGSVGITTDCAALFLARDLEPWPLEANENEPVHPYWIDYFEALDMALDGTIDASMCVAALLSVELRRQRGEWALGGDGG